jgi:hypothetical protein
MVSVTVFGGGIAAVPANQPPTPATTPQTTAVTAYLRKLLLPVSAEAISQNLHIFLKPRIPHKKLTMKGKLIIKIRLICFFKAKIYVRKAEKIRSLTGFYKF